MDSHFEGEVITKWASGSSEDRDMELVQDFAFVEPGKRWVAPRESVVNGASIPSGLWSIVGCPYVGSYRRASVIHDVYYGDHQGKTRKEVDEMFYRAMLLDGVEPGKAKRMYAGVRIGGGSAWESAEAAAAKVAAPPIDWSAFETWFDDEGTTMDKDTLDQALDERFGPIR